MVFRIRYRQRGDGKEGEAVVEANTPTEALVKFRHAHGNGHGPAEGAGQVTSVSSNGHDDETPRWQDS